MRVLGSRSIKNRVHLRRPTQIQTNPWASSLWCDLLFCLAWFIIFHPKIRKNHNLWHDAHPWHHASLYAGVNHSGKPNHRFHQKHIYNTRACFQRCTRHHGTNQNAMYMQWLSRCNRTSMNMRPIYASFFGNKAHESPPWSSIRSFPWMTHWLLSSITHASCAKSTQNTRAKRIHHKDKTIMETAYLNRKSPRLFSRRVCIIWYHEHL